MGRVWGVSYRRPNPFLEELARVCIRRFLFQICYSSGSWRLTQSRIMAAPRLSSVTPLSRQAVPRWWRGTCSECQCPWITRSVARLSKLTAPPSQTHAWWCNHAPDNLVASLVSYHKYCIFFVYVNAKHLENSSRNVGLRHHRASNISRQRGKCDWSLLDKSAAILWLTNNSLFSNGLTVAWSNTWKMKDRCVGDSGIMMGYFVGRSFPSYFKFTAFT